MKVYIETLGCPKNAVDSDFAAGILLENGYKITKNAEEADVVLVNTCAFINDAKEESINTILDFAQYKNIRKQILIVSGCLGERYNEELFLEMPEADIIIGVNDYIKLPEIINQVKEQGRKRVKGQCLDLDEIERKVLSIENGSAYLKIAEGCNNCCTYCIIPQIRGNYRSRRHEEILKEANALALQGCKEIVIIAQDVTGYGKDIYVNYALPELLHDLGEIENIKWIRLMYCYPDKITDELIDEIAKNNKVCKYIDIPIQHASNKILEEMNRTTTKEQIIRVIEKLREKIPQIAIRTTIITGFPGERAPEFKELSDFVKNMKFDRLGVFAYSKEEGTPAFYMKNQVRSDVKQRRKDTIMQIQQGISLEKNTEKIGKIFEVLVEEKIENENTYYGRTEYDAREIDNSVIFTSSEILRPGTFVKVKITDAFDYDLTGEAI